MSNGLNFEMGSNAAGLGIAGMNEVKRKLKQYADNIQGPWMKEALTEAAEVYKAAIEAVTPVGASSYRDYKGRPHKPGTAKRSVIIYRRKAPAGALTESNLDIALLVGYDKKKAFYMYWYEMGRKDQSARPFFKFVYASKFNLALAAATKVLKDRIGK